MMMVGRELAAGRLVISLRELPDGRWAFAWWYPMPTGEAAKWADGSGTAGSLDEAVGAAERQALQPLQPR